MKRLLTLLNIFIILLPLNAQVKTQISHPDWTNSSAIYEVNVRQFTPAGDFKSFEKHLPELKKLGVNILWLMPINPIGQLNRKGSLGSYYSVRDYKAVNPEFGTASDFKRLVEKIHKLNMRVIIDWVANHTSWDNVWIKDHPDFFTKDTKGNFVPPVPDWGDVIDLNYNNKELWNYMIDAMNYWVKEFDIDGFRCDVAAMVPTEFWIEAHSKLTKTKKIFMLAEANENYLHQAFDMTYNWPLKDLMNAIAQGKKKGSSLISFFENEKKEYNPNDYRMVFTSNHDENSWNGTEYERLGDGAKTFAVLCGTVPGMPLIYSGQEVGMNKRLRFFDKDTIEWKKDSMRDIYSKLNNLKKNNRALWNGTNGGEINPIESGNENVFAFFREKGQNKVLALFNLSATTQKVKFQNEMIKGSYFDLFNKGAVKFSNGDFAADLNPWEFRVYSK